MPNSTHRAQPFGTQFCCPTPIAIEYIQRLLTCHLIHNQRQTWRRKTAPISAIVKQLARQVRCRDLREKAIVKLLTNSPVAARAAELQQVCLNPDFKSRFQWARSPTLIAERMLHSLILCLAMNNNEAMGLMSEISPQLIPQHQSMIQPKSHVMETKTDRSLTSKVV